MSSRLRSGFFIRDGMVRDIKGIIKIVNSKNNRASFGWVPRVVLEDAITRQRKDGAASQHRPCVVFRMKGKRQEVVAWTRSYHRLDGVTSLHELGVAEDCQGMGIGSFLVEETAKSSRLRGMQILRLKTVVGLRSNAYYPRFGFRHVRVESGRKRKLNVYELALNQQ